MNGRSTRRDRIASRLVQLAFLIVLMTLWYLATTKWGVSHLLLPNPARVYDELRDVLGSGEFVPDLKITLTELAVAFALSSVGGITLGYVLSRSQYLIRAFEPLLAGVYSIPIILFLPLYVLFFGLGPASKIALGTTISFFPIVLNTIAGFGYGARDGGLRLSAVPLRAPAGGAAGDPHRSAHGVHGRALVDPRQRDHRLARRARPQDRAP